MTMIMIRNRCAATTALFLFACAASPAADPELWVYFGTYTGAKVADFQAVQVKLARARCLIDSARYLMRTSALAFQENMTIEEKLRLRAQNAFAVAQSREAVETLWSFYGANAIYTRDPLQRYLRDVQAASQHFSFNFDIAGSAYGTAALGGKYASPTL